MNTMELAQELVAGCREEREYANLDKLYAPDAISVEAADMGNGREVQGIEAIKGKHDWFNSEMDVLDHSESDPMPHGDDRFAVIFEATVKTKATGDVSPFKEVGIFHVADGKIVREEFYYMTG